VRTDSLPSLLLSGVRREFGVTPIILSSEFRRFFNTYQVLGAQKIAGVQLIPSRFGVFNRITRIAPGFLVD